LASKWKLKRKTNDGETEIIPNGATIYKWTTYTLSVRSEAFFNLSIRINVSIISTYVTIVKTLSAQVDTIGF
jgi:hypothetical protein